MRHTTYIATLIFFTLGYIFLLLTLAANLIVGDMTDVVLMIIFLIIITISLRATIRAQRQMTGRDS